MASPLRVLLLALCGCAAPIVREAPIDPLPYRPPQADILDYDISVDIDHRAGFLTGHVDILLAALPGNETLALRLDAVEMQVDGVWDDLGRPLEFRNDGRELAIELAEPLLAGQRTVIGIDYRCAPRRGMYFVGPSAADPDAAWHVWTQGQAQDTRHWLPCWEQLDDLATHTLRVTVDEAFRTMAAGSLEHSAVARATGRRTDTWRMDLPHAVSLVTLVAGELAHAELPGGEVPLPLVAEADALPHALLNFEVTADALAFLGEYTGRAYPFPKYAQCCVKEFRSGGMENVSATTLYHEVIHDPAHGPQVDPVDLIVHEAAHQWFGDLIGCRDWGEIWLNEGFATYAEALWFEHTEGAERMALWMLSQQRSAVRGELSNSRPIVWQGWKDPDEVFDSHAYPAAASRLHLLSDMLGPKVFREGVRRYVTEHASRVVSTADAQAAFEAASGRDLTRFFDEWLRGPGFPEFVVDVLAAEREQGDPPSLRAEQVQSERGWRPVFHLPVSVTWSRGGTERSARIEVDERVETLPLEGEGPLDWVRFDSGTTVPGSVDLGQSEAAWRRQLASARDPITRLIAAEWFAHSPHVRRRPDDIDDAAPESLAALREAARDDASIPVRTAALEALAVQAGSDDVETIATLRDALAEGDARLREAAAAGLGVLGDDGVLPDLTAALDDENQAVVAAALRALEARESPGLFSLCRRVAAGTDEMRLDRTVMEVVSGLEDDRRVVPFLLGAARREPVPRVRAAALTGLAGHEDPHGVIFRELAAALHDPSFQVRAAAARALGRRQDPAARQQLLARRAIESDAQVLGALDRALR
ncbi:MAG: M1 family aminopeptidase [Planctomycetota bacterium]|jgi:aminopeptidase N